MPPPRQPQPALSRRSASGNARYLCLLSLLVLVAVSASAGAVTVREERRAPAAPEAPRSPAAVAGRDSLLQEIRHYRRSSASSVTALRSTSRAPAFPRSTVSSSNRISATSPA